MQRASLPLLGLALCALVLSPDAYAQSAPPMRYIPAYPGNYTAWNSRTIDRIVIHTVEGSEGGAISWMRNPISKISAHYVNSLTGRITRMLRDSDKGYHCKGWNYRAIGIENEGWAYRNTWTEAQLRSLAHLTAYLCTRYRIPVDRTHIIGHVEVPGNDHTDPGPYFNWPEFMNRVRQAQRNGGASSPSAPAAPAGGTYTVRPGDSLSAIAARHRTTVSALASLNGISNPNVIRVGQVLRLPGSTSPAPAPAPTPTVTARAGQVTTSRLNVRAGVWGARLGSVSRGDRFVFTGRGSGAWKELFWRGRKAWVHGGYLSGASGTGLEVTTSALNVRSGASTAHARLGQVSRGQRYVQVGSSGSWRRVQFDDRMGWAHGNYLRRISVGP